MAASERVLRRGGLLVVDNVDSHPDQVAPLLALGRAAPGLDAAFTRTGKGQFLAVRRAPG